MKKVFSTLLFLCFSVLAFSQAHFNSVLAGSSTGTAVASSALEVRSTTRGFLPPRMTTTQRNAISSPARGLLVYDTTLNSFFVYYSAAWHKLGEALTNGNGTRPNGSGGVNLAGTQTANINVNPNGRFFSIGDSLNSWGLYVGDGSEAGVGDSSLVFIGQDVSLTGNGNMQTNFQNVTTTSGNGEMRLVDNAGYYCYDSIYEQGYYGIHGRADTGGNGYSNIYSLNRRTGLDVASIRTSVQNHVPSLQGFVNSDTAGNGETQATLLVEYDYWKLTVNDYVGKEKSLLFDSDSGLVIRTTSRGLIFKADTFGIVTFGSLDSVTAYALTPPNGSKVYCNNCTGNGVTGRFISYIGSAWRRETFQ